VHRYWTIMDWTIKGVEYMQTAKLIPAVLVIKPTSTAKADIETMSRQIAQVTTSCVPKDIHIEDIIVTFGTSKDIAKRVKSLVEHKNIQLLLLYSAKQAAENEQEYKTFVADMRGYGLKVICYR
jgi:hypothetical protein